MACWWDVVCLVLNITSDDVQHELFIDLMPCNKYLTGIHVCRPLSQAPEVITSFGAVASRSFSIG